MTKREFARRLVFEARVLVPCNALDAQGRVTGLDEGAKRIVSRIIEHALMQAARQQMAYDLTVDHVNAISAIMVTGARGQVPTHDYAEIDVGPWEGVLVEVLRVLRHGDKPPERNPLHMPPMQQMPAFNKPVQSSSADIAVGAVVGALGARYGRALFGGLAKGLGALLTHDDVAAPICGACAGQALSPHTCGK